MLQTTRIIAAMLLWMSSTTLVMPVVPMTVPSIDTKQLACMAHNIFHEAGSESVLGQAAVARVVLNRVKHGFARTPCTVIHRVTKVDTVKQCQFSWSCLPRVIIDKTTARYRQAEQVAYDVMVNDAYKNVIPKSAVFFHSVTTNPMWTYRQVAVIGNHIFYAKTKEQK